MTSPKTVKTGLRLFGLLLFGLALYMGNRDNGKHDLRSSANSTLSEQTVVGSTQKKEVEKSDDADQARREQVAQNMNSTFRRHGLDAHAGMVNQELVVSVDGLKKQSERDEFAGTYFSKKTQQGLCAMGIKKLLIAGSGVFADSTEYTLACKIGLEALAQQKQASELVRQSFAAQMSNDLKSSPVVERVEANGTELVLIGKSGLDVRTVKSTFIPGMGPSFISSVCGMHFLGLRVRKSIGDPGTLVSFHCSKN